MPGGLGTKMRCSARLRYLLRRNYSSDARHSAASIRKTFIDYFVNEHSHKFIKSSPVVPHNDPSLAFVNAGMNQFKSVLLGIEEPPAPRAVNSQKCIRVGGKHNDLDAVGTDGTHHTFFEMLGNWSFDNYFKADACKFAWDLLTGPYGLEKEKLVVTYFGGHKDLNLEADRECEAIWREMGLPPNQVIANGMADNFWEMGPVGPCGPCTEIYYADKGSIMELWNLVFIEYERKSDGQLQLLQKKHVDTGMGLERLTKVLQGANTNYDTDLFQPLFKVIQNTSGKPAYGGTFGPLSDLDTAYRILADHARAIAISLSDGIFPDQNYKLKRLIRKFFGLSERAFGTNGSVLLSQLLESVSEILGDTYPELLSTKQRSLEVLKQEYESFSQSKTQSQQEWGKLISNYPGLKSLPSDHPGLVQAVNEIKDLKEIPGDVAFRLHDSLGLNVSLIKQLASCFDIEVDFKSLNQALDMQKKGSRVVIGTLEKLLVDHQIPPTNDQSKYFWEYKNGAYSFSKNVACKVLAVVKDDKMSEQVCSGEECFVVTDHTHFYCEAGGQASDIGHIETPNGSGNIIDVQRHGKYIVHRVIVVSGSIAKGDSGKLTFDEAHRLRCMQNHSATHLLNAALHQLFKNTYQRSSHITPNYLTFDFSAKGALQEEQLQFLENFVRAQIQAATPIKRESVNLSDLPADAIKIPGEAYPDVVSVISMSGEQWTSAEPCCGTHCNNTADIKEFCITAEKSAGGGVRSVRALSGDAAVEAVEAALNLEAELRQVEEYVHSAGHSSLEAHSKLKDLKQKTDSIEIPLLTKKRLNDSYSSLNSKVTAENKSIARESLHRQVTECLASVKTPFVVSLLSSDCPEALPLTKANSMCLPERASLFISLDGDGFIRGRCTVPEDMVTKSFNAESWMSPALKVLGADGGPPKGKDGKLICLLKAKRATEDLRNLVPRAVLDVENFAKASLLLSALKKKQ